jgi:hypothetical protein
MQHLHWSKHSTSILNVIHYKHSRPLRMEQGMPSRCVHA